MEALEAIFKRKSVRHFTGEKLSANEIEILLRAGMAAPTAVNMQPWEFIVVNDTNLLQTMSENLPHAKMLERAAVGIVVVAVPEKAHRGWKEYAIIDCCCASENILIAAESIGLGGVWVAVYPNIDRIEFVRKILAIPQFAIPLNVITIGRPTGEDQPKDKFISEKIYFNKWGLR